MSINYPEASYFDGYHFAHIAAWLDHRLMLRRRQSLLRALEHQRRQHTNRPLTILLVGGT